jgi:hypothetical protein
MRCGEVGEGVVEEVSDIGVAVGEVNFVKVNGSIAAVELFINEFSVEFANSGIGGAVYAGLPGGGKAGNERNTRNFVSLKCV